MPKYNDFELDLQCETITSIGGMGTNTITCENSMQISCIPSCGPMCSTTPVKDF